MIDLPYRAPENLNARSVKTLTENMETIFKKIYSIIAGPLAGWGMHRWL
jgi:hypothetical protein